MTDIKISELEPAAQANVDDRLETSQVESAGFVSRSITLDQVATHVATSDQVADVIADAIGALPEPVSDWDDITGKPTTFPPTTPIPYTSISGTPSSLPPSGAAGGDLKNTYPNPLLKPGTDGQLMTTVAGVAAWAAPPSSAPSGAAGGDLAGTYPNPTIKASVALTGNPTAPTPTAGDNDTSIATTAFVTAALAAGASIAVGTTPPGSPAANALWWNSDAAVGGGQMFIFYDSFWVPASPGVGSGAVVQTVSFQTGAVATGTTIIPQDDTIPQIGEGTEFMTLAITPKSATSKLVIEVTWIGSPSVQASLIVALFQDATANALAVGHQYQTTAVGVATVSFKHVMTSGTTSATTFRVRAGMNTAGTTNFNGSSGARLYGGVMASSIVIQEVL